MLNKSGESGHLYRIPDLIEKAFSVSPLSIMLRCGLNIYGLSHVEVHSLYNQFVESFIMNRCLILSDAFSASIEMIK